MRAVVIGSSAGAVDALSAILPALPKAYALPVLIVVHLPSERPSLLAELLAAKCRIPVVEAEDKIPAVPGTAYLAPPDYHLLMEQDGRLSLSADPPVRYSRPSIDVLFETAADACGPNLVGVVLTGANSDGADGAKKIVEAGGTVIVQRPAGAFAPAMPSAALDACPTARTMDLPDIAEFLREVGAGKR